MCIALFSTAHSDYALVLINNRDEYLSRPTAPAEWWVAPNDHILGGRDLLRPIQGTWLGITKQGRLAVLTNFREEGQVVQESRSRGAMVNAFLMQDKHSTEDTASFARNLVEGEGVTGVGGFSLVCGRVGQPLAIISNRTPSVEGLTWIAQQKGETVGLSNAAFDDRSWPKVNDGETLMKSAIERSVQRRDNKEGLVGELLQLLSTDNLPRKKKEEGWKSYVRELRKSIFIPVVGGEGMDRMHADEMAAGKTDEPVQVQQLTDPTKFREGLSGLYGTQKHTVVLIDHQGHVTFVERTLYDQAAQPMDGVERDRWFEFDIE
ncbi:MAG: hypothetical protein L6R42_002383 [Xanthoria sp. 1 TBL-2021]|nr:MAG: hypothetical protein L6R42_002383 [Xanthoria sp. 1 TBL-2021]